MAWRGSGSPDVAGTVDQAVSESTWRRSRAGTRLRLSLSECRAEVYLFAEGSPWQKCCLGSSSLSSSCCSKEQEAFLVPPYPGRSYMETAGPGFRKLHRQATGVWGRELGMMTNLPFFSISVP